MDSRCVSHTDTHTHTHVPEVVDEGTISKLPVSERESTSAKTDSEPHALLLVLRVSATMDAEEEEDIAWSGKLLLAQLAGSSLASATHTLKHRSFDKRITAM